jgi:hypothetical protein
MKMAITVKVTEQQLLEEAEKALRDCLERAPFLSIKRVQREPRLGSVSPDIALKLKTPEGEQMCWSRSKPAASLGSYERR